MQSDVTDFATAVSSSPEAPSIDTSPLGRKWRGIPPWLERHGFVKLHPCDPYAENVFYRGGDAYEDFVGSPTVISIPTRRYFRRLT